MDLSKIKSSQNDDFALPISTEDQDTLRYVLEHVRGAYPDEPYRQADFDLVDNE